MRASLSILSLALAGLASAAQIPFLHSSQQSESRGAAAAYLSQPSDDVIYTYSHPSLPAHKIRFTQPSKDTCERESRSFSGYLDVNLDALKRHQEIHDPQGLSALSKHDHPNGTIEHFYFWAFESRSKEHRKDTMLWLNGGPGCSSFTGLLMELGPCNAAPFNTSKGPHTEPNPWSWNNNATMVFLDQPVGVGFSYVSWADKHNKKPAPPRVYSAAEAARDASAFLQLWAMHAKEIFAEDDESDDEPTGISNFHIAGESYAGRWIPLIASQLINDNAVAERHPERGIKPLPLRSVLIGNGITSPKHQFPAYTDYACSNKHGFGTFFPKERCDTMYQQIPACLALVEECNKPTYNDVYDTLACKSALTYCEGALSDPWGEDGKSFYDYKHMGDYEQEAWVAAFLNDKKTRRELGIDRLGAGDKHDGKFVGCSDDVFKHFKTTGDGAKDSVWAVQHLLQSDVKVLVYSGRRDFICNYLGSESWLEAMEWSGKERYNSQEMAPWYEAPVPGSGERKGRKAGEFKRFGNLSFVTVDESGHFVPLDQPAAALAMVNNWLHNDGALERTNPDA